MGADPPRSRSRVRAPGTSCGCPRFGLDLRAGNGVQRADASEQQVVLLRYLAAEFWQIYRPAAHLNPALYFAQPKVILVISALPKEDKTTVSTN